MESPAKAKTIQKYLGKGYEVMASMGHIRDLPKSRLGVDIENGFKPEYIDIRGKGELRNELKKKAKNQALSISQPTLTAKVKQFPGIFPTCWVWTIIRKTA